MQWRWIEGIYLGSVLGSREHYIGLPDGKVVRSGGIQTLPEERRWCAKTARSVKAMPWKSTATLKDHGDDAVPEPTVQESGGMESQVVPRNPD